jgi:hypothetical protein
MPSVLKRLEDTGSWTFPRALAFLVFIGATIFGAAAISEEKILQWWEAVIIAGAIVILVVALLWCCSEVRRLHR